MKIIEQVASAMMRNTILVVEDEPAISQVCQRTLTRHGYDVTLAADGRVAQEILLSRLFDVCLIDIRTPHMSGEDLFLWIKTNVPQLLKGIILTTGDVISQDTANFLAASGCHTLPKPFAPTELAAMVGIVTGGIRHGA